MEYSTEQELFWSGVFGDDYILRNSSANKVVSNVVFFSKIISKIGPIKSVIEFGSNIGLNLKALRLLLPDISLSAVEINNKAVSELQNFSNITIYNTSILEKINSPKHDLSFVKGVLIHINPESLALAYENIYSSTNKYILIAEYYNPTPVEIEYRGHKGKLFKRDFAGEMLRKYPDLKIIDYGFVYHKDTFPLDDINWFLLEKV
ncbi:MAG: pseudaminic acid biosynthesis-associated methylase [Deltaproteobacteria bacterium HGW-Deltaproteobacteria-18]|jgi:spore coat polysaccharide biosynthesis protein SpsF|nr:MAG: pseudaminic acid biosynthesis-associated methylase [Deltaproteobacteria bacterium HGW-Deltaproteobacteria-18]